MAVRDVEFCGDGELGYERSRTRFAPGTGLAMDDAYRLAHLPLVAPRHSRAIASRPGKPYLMGRRPRSFSLVLPIPAEVLFAAPPYRELEGELRAASFAGKVAWDLLEPRRDRLHATLCGGLGVQETAPILDPAVLDELARLGPIHAGVRGPFSGNVNLGRLYLPVYPERRDGENVFRRIQRILGRPETDLYLVGLHNLNDDLDGGEADALAALLERWRDRVLLRLAVDRLWLLGTTDDLVLDTPVIQEIPLTG